MYTRYIPSSKRISQTKYSYSALTLAMESLKWTASLSWRDTPCPLRAVLNEYNVPNLVRIEEGHFGKNEACSFETDQVLMLHSIRKRGKFLGQDSVGRPIAIPEECETKLQVCPLAMYCDYDPIYVCEMPNFYPDIRHFKIVESTQNTGIERYFMQGSTVKIEYIDEENLLVKFTDVKEPLPFNCRIAFEALLDRCEYTLKDAVKEFGLPIKVHFLTSETNVESPRKEYEKAVSKLGKVTIFRKSPLEVRVLASDFDANLDSVKVSLISKDCDLSVTVPDELLDGDPVYLKMVEGFNKKFFDKYDLKVVDNVNECHYLDGPIGNIRSEITAFFVRAKTTDTTGTHKRAETLKVPSQFQIPAREDDIYLLPVDGVNDARIHSQRKIRPSIKPKPARPNSHDTSRNPDKRNLGTAYGLDSVIPAVTQRRNEYVYINNTFSSTASDGNLSKPPLPEKKSVIRKQNAGEITAKNTITNLGTDSVNYQNMPAQKSMSMPRLKTDTIINNEPSKMKRASTVRNYQSLQKAKASIPYPESLSADLSSLISHDTSRNPEKRNLEKANGMDSEIPAVTERQQNRYVNINSFSSMASDDGYLSKPPLPEKKPVIRKQNAGEITAKIR